MTATLLQSCNRSVLDDFAEFQRVRDHVVDTLPTSPRHKGVIKTKLSSSKHQTGMYGLLLVDAALYQGRLRELKKMGVIDETTFEATMELLRSNQAGDMRQGMTQVEQLESTHSVVKGTYRSDPFATAA